MRRSVPTTPLPSPPRKAVTAQSCAPIHGGYPTAGRDYYPVVPTTKYSLTEQPIKSPPLVRWEFPDPSLDELTDYHCFVCGFRFTVGDWDERHTDPATNLEDIHPDCCLTCNPI